MSESDSFLSEVTEEVRKDQLLGFLRKNALYIGLGVAVIIGGAVALEWRKSSAQAAAEARGDVLWAALDEDDAAARAAALEQAEVPGDTGAAFLNLQRAAALLAGDDIQGAVEMLQQTASAPGVEPALRDVARLKLVSISADLVPDQERMDVLDQLLIEGHALRGLALEQRALIHLQAGDLAASGTDLNALLEDERTGDAVKQRAAQLLQVLGLTPEETAPETAGDE